MPTGMPASAPPHGDPSVVSPDGCFCFTHSERVEEPRVWSVRRSLFRLATHVLNLGECVQQVLGTGVDGGIAGEHEEPEGAQRGVALFRSFLAFAKWALSDPGHPSETGRLVERAQENPRRAWVLEVVAKPHF